MKKLDSPAQPEGPVSVRMSAALQQQLDGHLIPQDDEINASWQSHAK